MTPTEQDKELREKLTKLISQDGWVDTYEVDVEGQVAAIQTIIRNEKLKLLAEVRERVVGENETVAIKGIGRPDVIRDDFRAIQRAALTKLEAEL